MSQGPGKGHWCDEGKGVEFLWDCICSIRSDLVQLTVCCLPFFELFWGYELIWISAFSNPKGAGLVPAEPLISGGGETLEVASALPGDGGLCPWCSSCQKVIASLAVWKLKIWIKWGTLPNIGGNWGLESQPVRNLEHMDGHKDNVEPCLFLLLRRFIEWSAAGRAECLWT